MPCVVLVGMCCVSGITFYLSIIYHYSTVVLFVLFRLDAIVYNMCLFCDCLFVCIRRM